MKSVVLILIAAVVATGGSAIYAFRQLADSRLRLEGLQAQVDSKLTPAVIASDQSVQAESAAPRGQEKAGSTTAARIDLTERTAAQLRAARELALSPESRESNRVLIRGTIGSRYPDIDKVLGLSSDQLNKVLDALSRQQVEEMAEFRAKGGYDPATGKLLIGGGRQKENEAELESLLGSKYPRWQEYKKELPVRRQVQDLAVVLDSGGMELNDHQKAQLVAALAEERKRISSDTFARMQGDGDQRPPLAINSPENNRRLLQAASQILTAQQLEAFGDLQERQRVRELGTMSH
jgi:hypothetical protein